MRSLRCISVVSALSVAASICIGVSAKAQTPAPPVTITIDDTVVTNLLQMIKAHDDSDASINKWIDLPGNYELLNVGAAEDNLTRDQLRADVKAVIDGTANEQNQPKYSFGRIFMPSVPDYQAMLTELHQREHEWLNTAAQRDMLYAPNGVSVKQTVYLHLGGDWDALNRDGAIFINMAFFHDYFSPSWFGLNLLIAHETFHAVQNQAFGNPESSATADGAFYTALSKIQREGTARMVEVETDPNGYAPNTYGFYFRAVDNESIRQFSTLLPMLAPLTATCYPQYDSDKFAQQFTQGINSGGPYYTIGEGIASAIERYDGHKRLVETVAKGPLDFFQCYIDLTRKHHELPTLPDTTAAQIKRLRDAHKNGRLDIPNQPVNSLPTGR